MPAEFHFILDLLYRCKNCLENSWKTLWRSFNFAKRGFFLSKVFLGSIQRNFQIYIRKLWENLGWFKRSSFPGESPTQKSFIVKTHSENDINTASLNRTWSIRIFRRPLFQYVLGTSPCEIPNNWTRLANIRAGPIL